MCMCILKFYCIVCILLRWKFYQLNCIDVSNLYERYCLNKRSISLKNKRSIFFIQLNGYQVILLLLNISDTIFSTSTLNQKLQQDQNYILETFPFLFYYMWPLHQSILENNSLIVLEIHALRFLCRFHHRYKISIASSKDFPSKPAPKFDGILLVSSAPEGDIGYWISSESKLCFNRLRLDWS